MILRQVESLIQMGKETKVARDRPSQVIIPNTERCQCCHRADFDGHTFNKAVVLRPHESKN
jgi:hypothetical protein